MDITYTQKLIDYMERKGHRHIVVDLFDSATSTSGFTDICGRFANDAAVEKLESDGKIIRRFDGAVGDVIVTARALEYDDHIEFGLRSFFGLKDITFKGLRAFHL